MEAGHASLSSKVADMHALGGTCAAAVWLAVAREVGHGVSARIICTRQRKQQARQQQRSTHGTDKHELDQR